MIYSLFIFTLYNLFTCNLCQNEAATFINIEMRLILLLSLYTAQ